MTSVRARRPSPRVRARQPTTGARAASRESGPALLPVIAGAGSTFGARPPLLAYQPHNLLRLQRTVGNQSVVRALVQRLDIDALTRADWERQSAVTGRRRSTAMKRIDETVEAWRFARGGLQGTVSVDDKRAALRDVEAAIVAWEATKTGRTSARQTSVTELKTAVADKLTALSTPAGSQQVSGATIFAQAALDFWQDPSNATKALTDLTDHLLEHVNSRLPHPMAKLYNQASSPELGSFDRATWTITIWPKKFSTRSVTTVGQLNKAEVAAIGDMIFHEARHAEQHFRIAQLPGQARYPVPTAIKQAAKKAPLGPGTNRTAALAEAQTWARFSAGGDFNTYRNETLRFSDSARALMGCVRDLQQTTAPPDLAPKYAAVTDRVTGFYTQEEQRLTGLTTRTPVDDRVLAHIGDIKQSVTALAAPYLALTTTWSHGTMTGFWDAVKLVAEEAQLAYKDFEHERDAFAAGGSARDEFVRLAPP